MLGLGLVSLSEKRDAGRIPVWIMPGLLKEYFSQMFPQTQLNKMFPLLLTQLERENVILKSHRELKMKLEKTALQTLVLFFL